MQNQYQRRADLIPNLVETVKGYAAQEREVLTASSRPAPRRRQVKVDASTITDPAKFKEFQDAQNQLSGALGRLLVTVERYPELKSNQNFLALQSQLEGTENRIAVARRDYIQAVQAFNTEIRTFPGRDLGQALLWAPSRWRPSPRRSGAERPPRGEVLTRPRARRDLARMRAGRARASPAAASRARDPARSSGSCVALLVPGVGSRPAAAAFPR